MSISMTRGQLVAFAAALVALVVATVFATVTLVRDNGASPGSAPTTTPAPIATVTPGAGQEESTAAPSGASRRPVVVAPLRGRDLGWLTAVTVAGADLRVTVDRVVWLSGDAATRYNGGVPPENGFVIVNQSPRLRTFPVDDLAFFVGVQALGLDEDSASAEVITRAQFVEQARASLARGQKPLVALWHDDGDDASVVLMREQYLP